MDFTKKQKLEFIKDLIESDEEGLFWQEMLKQKDPDIIDSLLHHCPKIFNKRNRVYLKLIVRGD